MSRHKRKKTIRQKPTDKTCQKNNDRDAVSKDALEKSARECFGCSLTVYNEITKNSSRFLFAENTSGGNEEARLCMKSVPGSSWDRCEVYPTFVLDLKVEWEKRLKQNGKKLKLDIVWGEGDDAMIGAKGMRYFKDCFKQENCGEGIEVEVCEVPGASHDTVIDPCFNPMGELLDRVRKGWKDSK